MNHPWPDLISPDSGWENGMTKGSSWLKEPIEKRKISSKSKRAFREGDVIWLPFSIHSYLSRCGQNLPI
jgi:hypothetical protein